MLPTIERNPTSILVRYKEEGILIDCGEGTQRQLRYAKISPTKITKLLITHWHGDHVLGIPGLIQSLGANNYKKTLEIYGPKGSKKYLTNMLNGIIFHNRIKMKVKEIKSGIFFKNQDFHLESLELKHNIPCLGYSIQENDKLRINLNYTKKFGLTRHPLLGKLQQGKDIIYKGKKITVSKGTKTIKGKKLSIILDTKSFNEITKLTKNSNILICESTWSENQKNKKGNHLTSMDAAKIAKKSKAKKLILTHFSQRYKETKFLKDEAKKVFKNTISSKDFLEVNV